MKEAWLVVSAFLRTPSFVAMEKAFLEAAEEAEIRLELRDNASFLKKNSLRTAPPGALFFDKDVRLAQMMEQNGIRLFNRARAIAACDDKTATFLALEKAALPQARTILGPVTYPGVGYGDMGFLDDIAEELGLPLVIKEGYGSFGRQVYLAHSMAEMRRIVATTEARPLLFQTFVSESAGEDLRVYVVSGEPIAAIRRVNPSGDFRANLENGGKAYAYKPSPEERALAINACQAVHADFAGVDILRSNSGPLICEINSNAHFLGLRAATGVNPAEHILRLIREA
ncbi:MAG: RimK family alpha-L-glutamate ligase [Eubacteriales bacterium]|jgi:RimK family alpha-L-glutamate ligase|nr:RimK family alpha-L-glutamate ligase [Eubacteriales bacterium]MDD3573312.1 RimK family alpha-L-glutamate ligase [Eubacteriales bacterium]MDD4134414.1 RimK family alpha-L-glutamate ligase [Eubacteriales bacterium]